MSPSTATLFIDWLSLLDPEIVQSCPDLQQQLLFARKVIAQGIYCLIFIIQNNFGDSKQYEVNIL